MPETVLRSESRLHRLAMLLVSVLPLAISFRYFDEGSRSSTFGLSQLLYGGELGFHRRLLMGLPLQQLHFVPASLLVSIGQAMSVASVLVVYARFARPLFGGLQERLFFAFLLSGAGMLPHLAYLTGFPDLIQVMLTVGALSFLLRPSAVGILAGVTPLVVVSLFLHEGYVAQLYPGIAVVGAGIAIAQPRLRRPAVIHLAVVLACLAFLLACGRLDADGDIYLSLAQSRTDLILARDAFVPLTFDLHQQWRYLAARVSPAAVAGFLVTMATSLPYFLLLGRVHFLFARRLGLSPRRARIELVAHALPFGLMLVGHDWMRWVSFASMNVTLVIGYRYLCHRDELRSHLGELVASAGFQVGFLWTLVITPFGQIGGNRLTGKLAEMLSGS